MNTKAPLAKTVKIGFPIALGGLILWWMYRGFDWVQLDHVLRSEVRWQWMLLSLPFGILPQIIRGLRWKLALDPLDEPSRKMTCIDSIFASYAASLVIPRVGEVMRCGLLKRYDGVSFTRSLGTVITERVIDSLLVLLMTLAVLLMQVGTFIDFFENTGVSLASLLGRFTPAGYFVTLVCGITIPLMGLLLIHRLKLFSRVTGVLRNLMEGIFSLRKLRHPVLFVVYSLAIWVSYFLHFYLTFYAFGFTSGLGLMAGMVSFVVGTIAVVVPTPNGAGPWHFAVKTILVQYGVADTQAVMFALVVHTIQTLLLVVLGLWSALSFALKAPQSPKPLNN